MKRWIGTRLGVAYAGGLIAVIWLLPTHATAVLPSFQEVRAAHRPSDVRLLDRHGEVLHAQRVEYVGRRLAWTALGDISPAVPAAIIASEDRRFFEHGGVDAWAVIGAVWQWLSGGPRRGASTISMQLVTLLRADLQPRDGSRTMVQKWRQMRLAWALEHRWSKVEILEAYVNLVSFRGEIQGIAAAANLLFGKAPHGLTQPEAVVLAALLRGPNAPQKTVVRRAWSVALAQRSPVTWDEVADAVLRTFEVTAGGGLRTSIAPHAAQRLRAASATSTTVQSTLDASLQRITGQALRQHLLAVRGQHVHDGAVLVVENATGEVLAYVGGSGDLSTARFVDGVQAKRQTGSALKPFLYGLALERHMLTPASLLEDTPLDVSVVGGLYRPRNYDETFRGHTTMRTALAASLNIPAVRTLQLVGTDAFVQQLRHLGLEGAVEVGDYYGPALALGAVEANLWELVNAYRTLANAGVWSALRLTPEEDGSATPRRVYSKATAFMLSHILSDRDSRSSTFGLENSLATRFWSAVKTGTSKEMRDNWCVGYTQHYTVGVWVGNLSGAPMHNVSGMTGAAPIWLEVVAWLHHSRLSVPPSPPAGVLAAQVSFPDDLEPARLEWFLAGTEPAVPALQRAGNVPRIRAPASGTRIALDPDIPPTLQRLVFEADPAAADLRWVLNGQDIGPASGPQLWEPRPGQYALSLVDREGRALDSTTFVVRGVASSTPD